MGEGELVERILDGDEAAFNEFVHRYGTVIYAALRRFRQLSREDADDLAQVVFQRLLENNQRALRAWQGGSLAAYLRRMTRHAAIDALRARRPEDHVTIDGEGEDEEVFVPDPNPGPDAAALLAEQRRMMSEAMSRLAPADQDILRLVDLDGLTYAEAAGRLDITVNNVGVRVLRARQRLAVVIRQAYPALMEYL